MKPARAGGLATKPILLFNEECGACRRIARWVRRAAPSPAGGVSILERPIGHDPKALHSLHPDLSIRKAHAALHVLMPDGTTKLDGEAVAEVLRRLPSTRWFAWIFSIGVAVANFSIAESYKAKRDGEEETYFWNVTLWNQLAENVAESCKKGQRVVIEGRLTQQTWKGEDDVQHSKVVIIADSCGPDLRFGTATYTKGAPKTATPSGAPDEDLF